MELDWTFDLLGFDQAHVSAWDALEELMLGLKMNRAEVEGPAPLFLEKLRAGWCVDNSKEMIEAIPDLIAAYPGDWRKRIDDAIYDSKRRGLGKRPTQHPGFSDINQLRWSLCMKWTEAALWLLSTRQIAEKMSKILEEEVTVDSVKMAIRDLRLVRGDQEIREAVARLTKWAEDNALMEET